jgi:hypothetical protein
LGGYYLVVQIQYQWQSLIEIVEELSGVEEPKKINFNQRFCFFLNLSLTITVLLIFKKNWGHGPL